MMGSKSLIFWCSIVFFLVFRESDIYKRILIFFHDTLEILLEQASQNLVAQTQVYLWLIHIDVWLKPTQYCNTIILQLKINEFNLKNKGQFMLNSKKEMPLGSSEGEMQAGEVKIKLWRRARNKRQVRQMDWMDGWMIDRWLAGWLGRQIS